MVSHDTDFLSLVVERLLSNGIPLRDQLVVVPTKRTRVFLQHQLISNIPGNATILPCIVTIDEWITQLSGRVILDSATLVSKLYEVYATYLAQSRGQETAAMTTDQMLHLSQTERMLRDFQDMDLAMADVDKLLINVEALDEFDDYSFLTPEEKEAIRQFWHTLSSDTFDRLQGDYLYFAATWREVYHLFNEHLDSLGVAYRAGAYRRVAEDAYSTEEMLKNIHRYNGSSVSLVTFVGLYNLTTAELRIIKKLQSVGVDTLRVQLYWQGIYLDAAKEFTEHLSRIIYRNKGLLGGDVLGNGDDPKLSPEIHLISLSSTILQSQLVNDLVSQIVQKDPTSLSELRLAIILNDEKTLIPLMKSLHQPAYTSLNVTMGYPLQHTSVATWIRRYLNLFGVTAPQHREQGRIRLSSSRLLLWLSSPLTHRLFGRLSSYLKSWLSARIYMVDTAEVQALLEQCPEVFNGDIKQELMDLLSPSIDGHGLLRRLRRLLELLKAFIDETEKLTGDALPENEDRVILNESIDQIDRYVVQVSNILKSTQGVSNMLDTPQHVSYLLEQLIAVWSIPFEGDPLEGLQVMGFLETRTLNFDYLIMLNVQEGYLPKSSHTTTLIPDILRKAFRMTTHRTEDDTNAYHFYRLIEGAKEVYLLQDVRPKSISSMEPSRYVEQIRYLTPLQIQEQCYADPLEAGDTMHHTILGSEDSVRSYIDQLSCGEKAFSPSDLITYYKCPYQFYLKRVMGVGDPRPDPGVVTPIELGSLVHAYLNDFYHHFYVDHDGVVVEHDLDHHVSEERLRQIYSELISSRKDLDQVLLTDLKRYISKALEIDRQLLKGKHQLKLLTSEEKIDRALFVWKDEQGEEYQVYLTGQPDRVDLVDNQILRIVDYKTGIITKPKTVRSVDLSTLDKWRYQAKNVKLGSYVLQSYLYAMLYADSALRDASRESLKLLPTLYSLAPAVPAREGAIAFEVVDLNEIREVVTHYLSLVVDPHGTFSQADPSLGLCGHCNYKSICGRK